LEEHPNRPPAFLPIVVSIDCEPDPRVTPPEGPPPWRGLDEVIRILAWWRKNIPGARVGWYWRIDEQVTRGHGDSGWALHAYRSHIDESTALGDEHGLHPHLWRWKEKLGGWVTDAGDEDWVDSSIQAAIDNFRQALGRPARAFRTGDRHMSPRILRVLLRNGIECDLTPEPGAPAKPKLAEDEEATGMIADQRDVPRRPYRPAPGNPCAAARPRDQGNLWTLPLTTAPASLRNVATGEPAHLGYPPAVFRAIAKAGLAESAMEGAPYLSVVARSHVGALSSAAGHLLQNLSWLATGGAGVAPPRFVGPLEALQALAEI